MNKNEQLEYKIIKEYLDQKINRKDCAKILGLSERTITRKAKNIETKGILGIKHSNIGKVPINKTNSCFKDEVIKLVQNFYFDFNITHCREMLIEEHNIKINYQTLRRWCH
jgi:transposase